MSRCRALSSAQTSAIEALLNDPHSEKIASVVYPDLSVGVMSEASSHEGWLHTLIRQDDLKKDKKAGMYRHHWRLARCRKCMQ